MRKCKARADVNLHDWRKVALTSSHDRPTDSSESRPSKRAKARNSFLGTSRMDPEQTTASTAAASAESPIHSDRRASGSIGEHTHT